MNLEPKRRASHGWNVPDHRAGRGRRGLSHGHTAFPHKGAKATPRPSKGSSVLLPVSFPTTTSSTFEPPTPSLPRLYDHFDFHRDLNSLPSLTSYTPLLRAVYDERPSLCPSKTLRPSVSRFATSSPPFCGHRPRRPQHCPQQMLVFLRWSFEKIILK